MPPWSIHFSQIRFSFYRWIIFNCICIYSYIYRCVHVCACTCIYMKCFLYVTCSLNCFLPCFGYCEQCCSEHENADLFEIRFSFPLDKCWEVEVLDHVVVLFLIFGELSYCFPGWLHQFIFPSTVYKGPFSPYSHQDLFFFCFWL